MHLTLLIIFWLSAFIIVYSYLGYGMLMWMLVKIVRLFKGKPTLSEAAKNFRPAITLLICAYNEEDFIITKIEDCLALDYPKDLLTLLFVTDGSSDKTPEIIEQYPSIKLLHQPQRAGKIMAMNRGMKYVTTPVTIFCDANTLLKPDSLLKIVRHFHNPKTGCVAGEKQILMGTTEKASGAGEGIYWKYESTLKRYDSEIGSVVGAAGELFALRTDLFHEVEPDTLLDDFMVSLRIASQGYHVVYEPQAVAMERPTANIAEEFKRKIRICAGGIQSIVRLAYLLNIFKFGFLSFQYISHRVLRWSLTPLCLLFALITNAVLLVYNQPLYWVLMAGQLMFYFAALLGWYLQHQKIKVKALFVPYYFFIMNLSVYLGFMRYIKGQQSVLWEKVSRAS